MDISFWQDRLNRNICAYRNGVAHDLVNYLTDDETNRCELLNDLVLGLGGEARSCPIIIADSLANADVEMVVFDYRVFGIWNASMLSLARMVPDIFTLADCWVYVIICYQVLSSRCSRIQSHLSKRSKSILLAVISCAAACFASEAVSICLSGKPSM